VPIIPLHITAPKRWELRSWDRFQIPKPFSRITVTLGPPFRPGDDIDAARGELAAIMRSHTVD
jgi:lysophospholipid acyltransferase (LPLAT)-like uncharacterized protein